MQKVQNVNRILFLFFLLGISNSMFSQKALEGRFVGNTNWYQFHTDNTFDYADVGELGIKKEGRGHYTLTKDSLILKYDLTEIPFSGYHITKSYVNSKDSIDIKFVVYDFYKVPLPNTEIFISKGKGGAKNVYTDKNGFAKLTLAKEEELSFILVSYGECMHKIPEVYLFLNYEIDVYLTKKAFTEPFDRGKAIKNEIQKFKITKHKKDYLELQQPDGTILKLKKVEKGFYSDDPFE
ncbi:hypothetical protein ACILDT_06025 [Capnocytophaga canis]|uniref:Uncharacterized protein n=2 Tax=Capnocytophaga TaxID=1016 RepID=A0A0B7H421_9FLAO|nr:hypothetical protein [Capnocytophaga cynodegmi]CEN34366.1 conserved exported hypothetical protein [Capnocytophaga cynodegmi]